MVRFRKMNRDFYVIIDDRFPVSSSGDWMFGKSENSK